MKSKFTVIDAGNGRFIKAWMDGVKFEEQAIQQLKNTAQLPFIFKYVAALPDCHWGMGSTVGTCLPTKGAVCPAACGVDIGCGMMALKLSLAKGDLSDLHSVRLAIEKEVPAWSHCHKCNAEEYAERKRKLTLRQQELWERYGSGR